MSYAAFRGALYSGDARHPKLAIIRHSVGCRASISPLGYSAREQFGTAWTTFMGWFAVDCAYELLLYLPNREEVLAGEDLAGGQFHRWERGAVPSGSNVPTDPRGETPTT